MENTITIIKNKHYVQETFIFMPANGDTCAVGNVRSRRIDRV